MTGGSEAMLSEHTLPPPSILKECSKCTSDCKSILRGLLVIVCWVQLLLFMPIRDLFYILCTCSDLHVTTIITKKKLYIYIIIKKINVKDIHTYINIWINR